MQTFGIGSVVDFVADKILHSSHCHFGFVDFQPPGFVARFYPLVVFGLKPKLFGLVQQVVAAAEHHSIVVAVVVFVAVLRSPVALVDYSETLALENPLLFVHRIVHLPCCFKKNVLKVEFIRELDDLI